MRDVLIFNIFAMNVYSEVWRLQDLRYLKWFFNIMLVKYLCINNPMHDYLTLVYQQQAVTI